MSGKTLIATSRRNEATIDADFVRYRLDEAGKCLLSLPSDRIGPAQLKAQTYGYISEYASGYAPQQRPPIPEASTISRMDEAFAWLPLIDTDTIRRIVAMRCLVSPLTERHDIYWAGNAALNG